MISRTMISRTMISRTMISRTRISRTRISRTRIVAAALLAVGFFAGGNSAALGETAGESSRADTSVEAGEIQQLKAVVEHQQRQLEEQRQALEVQRALLQKLERKVAELSRGFSSEQRAFADKQALAAQGAPSPPREPARSAAPQTQAALAGAPSSSVPEKEPRSASSTSAQNLKPYWKEGLRFDSADKSQRLRVGGRIMNDWGFFSAGDELNDAVGPVVNGTEFRRSRLYVSGRMYDRVNFKAQYDFAGGSAGFKDVYIGIDKIPGAGKLRVGHFKEPFSLEMQTSSKYITFMERSLANVFAPERNSGMMIANTGFDKRLTWAVGAFRDSDGFGEAAGPGNYAVTGRVTTSPWYADGGSKLLHLGLAYSHRNPTGDTLRIRQRPEAHLTTRFVDTGRFPAASQDLVGVEAALVVGPASFQSEYIHNSVHQPNGGDLSFGSFYLQGGYFLTGERRPYRDSGGYFSRVKPLHNLGDRDGWGAWEIALRYSQLDLNDRLVRGGELRDVTLGLNWYLNPNTRFMWNYVFADRVELGEAHLFQTRFQVDF